MVMALYSHYRNAWKSHGVSSHISKIKDSMLHHIYYGLLLTFLWLFTLFLTVLEYWCPKIWSHHAYWLIALLCKERLYVILQALILFWKACWRIKLKRVTDSSLREWVKWQLNIQSRHCCVNKLAREKFFIVVWVGMCYNQISDTSQYVHICVTWTHVLLCNSRVQ